MGKTANFCFL